MTEAAGTSAVPARPAGAGQAVAVLICDELARLRPGIDVPALVAACAAHPTVASARAVSQLCTRFPREDLITEGVPLVLGLCGEPGPDLDGDRRLRRAGIEPYHVHAVNLGDSCARLHERSVATERARALLGAAVAGAHVFTPPPAATLVPRLARLTDRASRRVLLTLPPIRYSPTVAIDATSCSAAAGCAICAGICPRSALTVRDSAISVDREACDACGLCIAACPESAARLPALDPASFDASLRSLLAPAAGWSPVFVCRGSVPLLARIADSGNSYAPEWLPMTVPCASVLAPAVILGTLALGAGAVSIVGCGSECSPGRAVRSAEAVDYCRELLPALGHDADRVRLVSPSPSAVAAALATSPAAPARSPVPHALGLLAPASLAPSVLALAAATGCRDGRLDHPASPLGIVEIDPATCTTCGACSVACPTGALRLTDETAGAAIIFDPTRCVACGECERRCPDRAAAAITLHRVTDATALRAGPQVIHRDRTVYCAACGGRIGPARLLQHVRTTLEGELNEATLEAITRACVECRAAGRLAAMNGV